MSIQTSMRRAADALGTQKRLAEAAGVSQQWVSDAIRGLIGEISVTRAFAIERATDGLVRAHEFAGPPASAPEAREAPPPSARDDAGAPKPSPDEAAA